MPPVRAYPDPQYTVPSTTAGPATTDPPAGKRQRISPLDVSSAYIWSPEDALTPANTTPWATVNAARSGTPPRRYAGLPGRVGSGAAWGSAVCQTISPGARSKAAPGATPGAQPH